MSTRHYKARDEDASSMAYTHVSERKTFNVEKMKIETLKIEMFVTYRMCEKQNKAWFRSLCFSPATFFVPTCSDL
ncbi:hypothetical protein NQ314_010937 [Rhamnusium bicolor]|uniref:Uncharacterized protein n=1 Tax=Rhamnusium bicolor TaxID=1586634 RepID=A0AAV8XM24_9CUCU|nr:hypothetical protein NQ314_010937 [Rhamnusium bicolor]